MKKLFKTLCVVFSLSILVTGCSTNTNGTVVGTVNDIEIVISHFETIFAKAIAENESSSGENSTENTKENSSENSGENSSENSAENSSENSDENLLENTEEAEEELEYDGSTAIIVSVLTPLFKATNNFNVDRKLLNTALNNLKANDGDNFLKKAAEETYKVPLKSESELLDILRFSLAYSAFIEKKADITLDDISAEYYKNHAVTYCSYNLLTESEKGAQKIQDKINSGEKTFEEYALEALEIQNEQAGEDTEPITDLTQLMINDIELDGVKIAQISYLDCKSAASFVPEFGAALEALEENTTSTEIIKSDYGYHIIDLKEIVRTDLTAELQNTIEQNLIQEKSSTAGFAAYYIMELINSVEITFTNEVAEKEFEEYRQQLEEQAALFSPNDDEETNENSEENTVENSNENSTTNNG